MRCAMSRTSLDPRTSALLARFSSACRLSQSIDRAAIRAALQTWARRVTAVPLQLEFIDCEQDLRAAIASACAAREAQAPEDGWAAWRSEGARRAAFAGAAFDAEEAWNASLARGASMGRSACGIGSVTRVWDATFFSIAALGAAHRGDEAQLAIWLPMFEAFEAGAFCFFVTADKIHVATLPARVCMDDQRRLHCQDGPAFVFLRDMRQYFWHGTRVPEHVVLRPSTMTIADISAMRNVNVRRVMIEKYGAGRFIVDSRAEMIAADEFGELYRTDLDRDEPLVMLKVLNSTREADGSTKEYFLRVPPQMKTPHEAVAWTFGLTPQLYAPLAQT